MKFWIFVVQETCYWTLKSGRHFRVFRCFCWRLSRSWASALILTGVQQHQQRDSETAKPCRRRCLWLFKKIQKWRKCQKSKESQRFIFTRTVMVLIITILVNNLNRYLLIQFKEVQDSKQRKNRKCQFMNFASKLRQFRYRNRRSASPPRDKDNWMLDFRRIWANVTKAKTRKNFTSNENRDQLHRHRITAQDWHQQNLFD